MNKNGGISLKPRGTVSPFVPLTAEDQIKELILTVKCKLAPSKVDGIGVVALYDIDEGEDCFCAPRMKPEWYNVGFDLMQKKLGTTYPEILKLILDRWPHVVNAEAFLSPNFDARLISFMNHGDDPNYDPKTDKALRKIKAGEELLEDYRIVPNFQLAYPWLSETPVV